MAGNLIYSVFLVKITHFGVYSVMPVSVTQFKISFPSLLLGVAGKILENIGWCRWKTGFWGTERGMGWCGPQASLAWSRPGLWPSAPMCSGTLGPYLEAAKASLLASPPSPIYPSCPNLKLCSGLWPSFGYFMPILETGARETFRCFLTWAWLWGIGGFPGASLLLCSVALSSPLWPAHDAGGGKLCPVKGQIVRILDEYSTLSL